MHHDADDGERAYPGVGQAAKQKGGVKPCCRWTQRGEARILRR